jgi:hypothetical protein
MVNNHTFCPGCKAGIRRADIEESKSNVAMNAWLPQASYPCGNFSDTSSVKVRQTKGSLGHAFTVYIRTENLNQISFYPFVPHEISVLIELILGHLCYHLTDVPPQPNSPPDSVSDKDREPSVMVHVGPRSPSHTGGRLRLENDWTRVQSLLITE